MSMILRLRVWKSVGAVVAMELGCLILFCDNPMLNVILLVCPLEAIEPWEMGGRPG